MDEKIENTALIESARRNSLEIVNDLKRPVGAAKILLNDLPDGEATADLGGIRIRTSVIKVPKAIEIEVESGDAAAFLVMSGGKGLRVTSEEPGLDNEVAFVGLLGPGKKIVNFENDMVVLRSLYSGNLGTDFEPSIVGLDAYLSNLDNSGRAAGISLSGGSRKKWLVGPVGRFLSGGPGYCEKLAIGIYCSSDAMIDGAAVNHFGGEANILIPTSESRLKPQVEEGSLIDGISGPLKKIEYWRMYCGGDDVYPNRTLLIPRGNLLLMTRMFEEDKKYVNLKGGEWSWGGQLPETSWVIGLARENGIKINDADEFTDWKAIES